MANVDGEYIAISFQLDKCGLIWHPEIGDEVIVRPAPEIGGERIVSILVDPQGMSPGELRKTFVWLPTLEQLVNQIEARQALVYHAGVCDSLKYEAVIKTAVGLVEVTASTLRAAFGIALKDILTGSRCSELH